MPHPYLLHGRAIERSMLLAAPPDDVRPLLQTPEGLATWLADRVETFPGGLRVVWQLPDREEAVEAYPDKPREGEVCAYKWESVHKGYDTRFSFGLLEEDGGCRLVFREDGFGDGPEWDQAIAEQAQGWADGLGKLGEKLGLAPGRTIEVSVDVPAPPERVYHALLSYEDLEQFFSWESDVDPRQGGSWRFTQQGSQKIGEGRIFAMRPLQQLAMSWQWYRDTLPPTEVAFDLAPHAAGTTVTVRHAGWGHGAQWNAAYQATERAWRQVLEELVYHLSPKPAEAVEA